MEVVTVKVGYADGETELAGVGVATPDAAFDLLASYLEAFDYHGEGFIGVIVDDVGRSPNFVKFAIGHAHDMKFGDPAFPLEAVFITQSVHTL